MTAPFAHIAGSAIRRAQVTIPASGLWSADVMMTDAVAFPAPVVVTLGDLALTGAVFRASSFTGSRSARLVGGAGGWRLVVPAKYYDNGACLSQVLADLAAEVGETVALFADRELGAFTRENAPATRALNQLVGAAGWYVRPDGVTAIETARDTSAIRSRFDALRLSGAEGRWLIAADALADWMPGRTFTAPTTGSTIWTISATSHIVESTRVRTEALVS